MNKQHSNFGYDLDREQSAFECLISFRQNLVIKHYMAIEWWNWWQVQIFLTIKKFSFMSITSICLIRIIEQGKLLQRISLQSLLAWTEKLVMQGICCWPHKALDSQRGHREVCLKLERKETAQIHNTKYIAWSLLKANLVIYLVVKSGWRKVSNCLPDPSILSELCALVSTTSDDPLIALFWK